MRAAAAAALLLVSGVAACGPRAPVPEGAGDNSSNAVRFPPQWPMRERARPFTAERAAVASNSHLASVVGVEMLRRGGNAVDAAVATGFALAVTHPEAASLGGGGFMVVHLVAGGGHDSARAGAPHTVALDFRETAPAAATRNMFASAQGRSPSSTLGYHAVAVPGLVAGLIEAQRRYGSLPLETLIAPAIRLAQEGFVVDSMLARSILANRGRIERFAGRDLLMPRGNPLVTGDTLRQPALASTLRRIAAAGAPGFYTGPVAAAIAADVRRNGGILTASDLAGYRAVWRPPVSVEYRGYTIIGPPLPSSGILTAGEALMILEALGPAAPFGSVRQLHNTASALQLAFIDRMRLGDPRTTPSSAVQAMLDRNRAVALARSVSPARATPTAEIARGRVATRDGTETTHWSVVDARGNAVAVTTTINDIFGSGVFVREAGVFLSDTMDDFATQPGAADQYGLVSGDANAIAGGKRPLSSMTPFILLDGSGSVALVAGSRGGPRIISNVLQLVTNVVDHRMPVSDAISAPRIHHQGLPDQLRYEVGGYASAILDSLRAMGHPLAPFRPDTLPYMGRAVAIGRTRTGWEAVVDPRFGALSAGY